MGLPIAEQIRLGWTALRALQTQHASLVREGRFTMAGDIKTQIEAQRRKISTLYAFS